MHKIDKFIILFVICFISMFLFSVNVYAAKELTCLYDGASEYDGVWGNYWLTSSVVLIQEADGNILLFSNGACGDKGYVGDPGCERKLSDSHWVSSNGKYKFDESVVLDSNKNLTKCPAYANVAGGVFSENTGSGYWNSLNTNQSSESVVLPGNYKKEEGSDDNGGGNGNGDNSGGNGNGDNSGGGLVSTTSLEEAVHFMDCKKLRDDGILVFSSDLLMTPKYSVNCIYTKSIDNTCIILQLSFDPDTGEHEAEALTPVHGVSIRELKTDSYHWSLRHDNGGVKIGSWETGFGYTLEELENEDLLENHGACPVSIGYYSGYLSFGYFVESLTAFAASHIAFVVNDSNTGMELNYVNSVPVTIPSLVTPGNGVDEDKTCSEMLGATGITILKVLVNVFRILIAILLIVLGSLDFLKAIFAQESSDIKKAQQKFIKRLIIATIIFFIPNFLHIFLRIAKTVWPSIIKDDTLCGLFS